jgi:hypothetical protein
MKRAILMLVALAILGWAASSANADIIVSTGYNDDPNENPLPNPWVGSPNTIVIGNSSQIALANSIDPDLDAILFQNTGATAVVLSSLVLMPSGYNLFTMAGQLTPVTINPGQNLIVLGVDGSDALGFTRQTVNFTLDGTNYSPQDAVTADAFDGVLSGKVNWKLSETEPWTQILDIGAASSAAPEPSSLAMLGMAATSFAGYFGWRRRRQPVSA